MDNEQEKYKFVWTHSGYRTHSPELRNYDQIKEFAKGNVVFFGVGTGRAAYRLRKDLGCKVTGIDIADNCLDSNVKLDEFIVADISEPLDISTVYDTGICMDVMEHLPPEKVLPALKNIRKLCKQTLFHIPSWGDSWYGEKLHLTVEEPEWWTMILSSVFAEVKQQKTVFKRSVWFTQSYVPDPR